jgi:hypothetical protein
MTSAPDQRGCGWAPAPVGREDTLPAVLPRSPLPVLVARAAVAVLVLLNLVGTWMSPAGRTVDELLAALSRGDVRTLTVEFPPGEVLGPFRAEWTGSGRAGTTLLQVETVATSAGAGTTTDGGPGTEDVVLDQRREVLDAAAASPGDVRVSEVADVPWRGSWLNPYLAAAAFVAAFVLLVTQPGPHLATRWAWFWLGAFMWPFWLAYVLLEPTPLWSRRPVVLPVWRLTGLWAWLLAVVLGNTVVAAVTGA